MGDFFEMRYGKYYVPMPDVDAYLERIGLKNKDIVVSKQGLNTLQKAQLCSVPFENIDLYDYEQPVDFGTEALFEKIVIKHRGGYCFELNTIFMSLLKALGFEVYPTGA